MIERITNPFVDNASSFGRVLEVDRLHIAFVISSNAKEGLVQFVSLIHVYLVGEGQEVGVHVAELMAQFDVRGSGLK